MILPWSDPLSSVVACSGQQRWRCRLACHRRLTVCRSQLLRPGEEEDKLGAKLAASTKKELLGFQQKNVYCYRIGVVRKWRQQEVGIYKRTQESKKTRKKEKKNSTKKATKKKGNKEENNQESDQEKRKFFFSFFLGRFLVFLIAFLVEFFFSFFLVF